MFVFLQAGVISSQSAILVWMRDTVSHLWFCCLKADNWEFMVSSQDKLLPQGYTNTLTSVHFVFIHCKQSRELLHTNSLLDSPPNPTGSRPFWILWSFFPFCTPHTLANLFYRMWCSRSGVGNLRHSKSHLDPFPTVKKTQRAAKPFGHPKWR